MGDRGAIVQEEPGEERTIELAPGHRWRLSVDRLRVPEQLDADLEHPHPCFDLAARLLELRPRVATIDFDLRQTLSNLRLRKRPLHREIEETFLLLVKTRDTRTEVAVQLTSRRAFGEDALFELRCQGRSDVVGEAQL